MIFSEARTVTLAHPDMGGSTSVSCVEWNRVGDCLATSSVNATVRLWNVDRPAVRS